MTRPLVDWQGSFAVIVTPFAQDGAIDEDGYRRVIDLIIDAGCHGVIAAGSTGEFFLMTDDERKRVFEIAVDQVAGRIPVLACPTALRIEETVDLTRHAATVGCTGIMALPGLYAPLDDDEVKDYYRRLADEGGLPIMLYNSPRYVNTTLTAPLVAELMNNDAVVAIKDSSFEIYPASELIRLCGPELRVFIGLEDLLLPAVAIGAVGAVAMMPQVVGRMAVELYEAAVGGERERARDLHDKICRAYDIFKVGSGYVGIKEAMNLLGKPGGCSRPPMRPYSAAQKDQLCEILSDLGLPQTRGAA